MTRHPATGAVERRMALSVNFLTSGSLRNLRRSGALQGAVGCGFRAKPIKIPG